MEKRLVKSSLLSAAVGAVVASAVLLGTSLAGSDDSDSKTVVEQSPLANTSNVSSSKSKALTPSQIYSKAAPGVVYIRSQVVRQVDTPFGFSPQEQSSEATGSGFVLDKDGLIMTNAHVIAGASKVTVTFGDDKTVDAKVVGKDLSTDIALLKVDVKDADLKPLSLADSDGIQVGDATVAIGNPFGLDRTLTTGVISARQREISAPNGFTIRDVIQTDAAINPGNSGGPLLNAAGEVIGINSQIATDGSGGQGNIGIGFAVPINTAKEIMPQLEEKGRAQHAFLGISGVSIDDKLKSLNLPSEKGVLVQTVTPDSPASEAGIKGGDTSVSIDQTQLLLGGDVVLKLNDDEITTMDQLAALVDKHKPGEELKLEILRDGKNKTITVKLGNRPNQDESS